ncbi:MAG TPA: thioredoxin domain-containing protein [Longimicrobiales bacterium]|nr:thioredoxin domain-containing protein [Longimicrobiales bacterium]
MTDRQGRNALADERSPFLQHGSTQPVDWLPWGDEAFERARREDRPILLDIGAVWCHWCHVMDRESYEDEATAALINEHFVPVKVDRDERPDVDARYQRAVQLLTGQGGWPLTAFLTPDGDAFYGGTYFPPDDRFGRPSFQRVLRDVDRVWREERGRADSAAAQIGERLVEAARAERRPGDPSADLIAETVEELAQSFDFRYGGFGRAPKFPNAGALDLLLDEALDNGTEWAHRIVYETLHAMIRGGFHDQVGGGFHRYSTDARWIIPHFEKMAYDNGVLLATCARASVVVDDGACRAAAEGVLSYYRDVAAQLVDAGGFPASQDADHSPEDDGDYWTWTRQELRAALGDDDLLRTAVLFYGHDDAGSAMHLDPSRRVLFQALSLGALARELGVDAGTAALRVQAVRDRLKAARDGRPRPYVDTTLYSGWVALVASGFLAAARHLDSATAGRDAVRALRRLWREGFREGRGMLHRVGDDGSGVHLDDQAHAMLAFLDAFEYTQDPAWLADARVLGETMLARFSDPDGGGLRDRPVDERGPVVALDRPYLPIADAPAPSGNGSAALALLRLHALTGDEAARESGLRILGSFAGSAPRLGSSAATYVKATAWAVQPVTTVVVVEDDDGDRPLLREALRRYRPRTVVRHYVPGAADTRALPAPVAAMLTSDAPRAYVCAGRTCAAPVADAAALADVLRNLRG